MRKITIFDGPGGATVEYIEGVTEPGGSRKPVQITYHETDVLIDFDNKDFKRFSGFRSIVDEHHERKEGKQK